MVRLIDDLELLFAIRFPTSFRSGRIGVGTCLRLVLGVVCLRTSYLRLGMIALAHVHSERDATAGQQTSQTFKLVLRQGVHRIDDHRGDASGGLAVSQLQAFTTNDGIEEALGLSRSGACANECRLSLLNHPYGSLLMPVHPLNCGGNDLAHVRMKDAFVDQLLDLRSLTERSGQTDVRPSQQRRAANLVRGEQIPHLTVQPGVREGIRRKLLRQEVPNDLLGVDDRVDGHGITSGGRKPASPAYILSEQHGAAEAKREQDSSESTYPIKIDRICPNSYDAPNWNRPLSADCFADDGPGDCRLDGLCGFTLV